MTSALLTLYFQFEWFHMRIYQWLKSAVVLQHEQHRIISTSQTETHNHVSYLSRHWVIILQWCVRTVFVFSTGHQKAHTAKDVTKKGCLRGQVACEHEGNLWSLKSTFREFAMQLENSPIKFLNRFCFFFLVMARNTVSILCAPSKLTILPVIHSNRWFLRWKCHDIFPNIYCKA